MNERPFMARGQKVSYSTMNDEPYTSRMAVFDAVFRAYLEHGYSKLQPELLPLEDRRGQDWLVVL